MVGTYSGIHTYYLQTIKISQINNNNKKVNKKMTNKNKISDINKNAQQQGGDDEQQQKVEQEVHVQGEGEQHEENIQQKD